MSVKDLLNFDLSTAKAPPAGTAQESAVFIIKELKVLNSSCSNPDGILRQDRTCLPL